MKRKDNSKKVLAIALILGMILTAIPAATASHRSFYDKPSSPGGAFQDDGLRVTNEPDFESTDYWTPGEPIDNCVVDLEEVWDGSLPASVDLDPNHNFAGQCDSGATSAEIGGSQLFLDGNIYLQPMHGQVSSAWLNYNFLLQSLGATQSNVLLPGRHGMYAYFGHWNDKNADNRIDDICKWDTARAASDEFLWRGQSTGENGGVWNALSPPFKFIAFAWMDPGNFAPGDPSLSVNDNRTARGPDQQLGDRTSEDSLPAGCPSNTGYVGGNGNAFWTYQASMVWTVTMLTAVNPAPLPAGTPGGWDMSDAPFQDVDKYTAFNPQIEALYTGLHDGARSQQSDAINATNAAVAAGLELANQTINAACALAQDESGKLVCDDPVGEACNELNQTGTDVCAQDPVADGCAFVYAQSGTDVCNANTDAIEQAFDDGVYEPTAGRANRILTAPRPHEPNTPFDEYPGATYGGTSYTAGGCGTDTTSQPRGSCNNYSGYQEGWHAWLDSNGLVYQPQSYRPAAYDLIGLGGATGGGATTSAIPSLYLNGAGHGRYNDQMYVAGHWYHFQPTVGAGGGSLGQHRDVDGNTWIGPQTGDRLDPNEPYGNVASLDFGSDRSFYRQDGGHYYNFTYTSTRPDGEFMGLCGLQGRVADTTVKLVPVTNGELDPSGSWGKGLLVRWNHLEPGKPVPPTGDNPGKVNFELILTGEVILNEACGSTVGTDAVGFLGGNYDGVDFAVVTRAVINVDTTPEENLDALVTELVKDVDIFSVAN